MSCCPYFTLPLTFTKSQVFVATLYVCPSLQLFQRHVPKRHREFFLFQARSVGSKLWQPENGTREEWVRCHGIPCEQWQRAERKLAMLKTLALDDRKGADYPVRYLMFYLRYNRQV